MMKKSSNLSLLVYAVILVLAYFLGNQILGDAGRTVPGSLLLFAFISILIGFVLNVVLMEVGHVIGAKIGGYRILSVSILGLTLVKTNNHWHFTFGPFDGFTGETVIGVKNPRTKEPNPAAFFWGGTLVILIEIAILIALPFAWNQGLVDYPAVFYGGFIAASIGGMLLIYNVMPIRLDTSNDAIYMMHVKKNNRALYNETRFIQGQLYEGDHLGEVEPSGDVDFVSGKLHYYAALSCLYQNKLTEAEAIIDRLMENSEKLSDEVYQDLIPFKVYLLMMTTTKEQVESYMEKLPQKLKKTISAATTIEGARTYLHYAVYILDQRDEYVVAKRKYEQAEHRLRELGRLEDERQLLHKTQVIVESDHPEWLSIVGE